MASHTPANAFMVENPFVLDKSPQPRVVQEGNQLVMKTCPSCGSYFVRNKTKKKHPGKDISYEIYECLCAKARGLCSSCSFCMDELPDAVKPILCNCLKTDPCVCGKRGRVVCHCAICNHPCEDLAESMQFTESSRKRIAKKIANKVAKAAREAKNRMREIPPALRERMPDQLVTAVQQLPTPYFSQALTALQLMSENPGHAAQPMPVTPATSATSALVTLATSVTSTSATSTSVTSATSANGDEGSTPSLTNPNPTSVETRARLSMTASRVPQVMEGRKRTLFYQQHPEMIAALRALRGLAANQLTELEFGWCIRFPEEVVDDYEYWKEDPETLVATIKAAYASAMMPVQRSARDV